MVQPINNLPAYSRVAQPHGLDFHDAFRLSDTKKQGDKNYDCKDKPPTKEELEFWADIMFAGSGFGAGVSVTMFLSWLGAGIGVSTGGGTVAALGTLAALKFKAKYDSDHRFREWVDKRIEDIGTPKDIAPQAVH